MGPLPIPLIAIAQRLVDYGYFADLPDQVITNEYRPGQGLRAHIDCVPCFDDTIVSVSLLSPGEMVFTAKSGSVKSCTTLERRSAIILPDEARYDWTHAIPARKSDTVGGIKVPRGRRISLTFKKVVG